MREVVLRVIRCLALLLASHYAACLPQIIVAERNKKGLSFIVGMRGKCVRGRTNLTSRVMHSHKAAYFYSTAPGNLFGGDYWNPNFQRYRISVLNGVSETLGHANPTLDEYLIDIFAPNVPTRHFVPPKEYTVEAKRVDAINLSYFSMDVTSGVVYNFDKHIGLWFKGYYAFGLEFANKNTELKNKMYDIVDDKLQTYTPDNQNAEVTNALMRYTYNAFDGHLARCEELKLELIEGFSALVGFRYSPVPKCILDLGAGLRRYLVRNTWKKCDHAYPYPSSMFRRDYAIGASGETAFWTPYDKDIVLEEVFWPLVVMAEVSYVSGVHCLTFGFEYISFQGVLREKSLEDKKTSRPLEEREGMQRVQKYPLEPPAAAHLVQANEMGQWAMSVVPEININYKAHISSSIFSFCVGYVFQV